MTHPMTHSLIYGDSGSGKTTAASSWPKPALVFMFDPYSKETPYLSRGNVVAEKKPDGTHLQAVLKRDDASVLFHIEHYIDANPQKPEAYRRFTNRLPDLERDIEAHGYKTVILDSVTFMELSARKLAQYVLNPTSREPRQWFASATDSLEEVLMIRFGSLFINVVVLAHVDEDKDEVHGFMLANPAAPGRLRKRSPAGFGELYRQHVATAEDGSKQYVWQTRPSGRFNASSQVNAPDPCDATYSAIWMPS